ncbi:DUF4835 family protein [Hwangdonia lutea]|uniref:DUF4835 family protein n=1 Tax=Hwangdonia lutea TaxID=3075823 RepID=A0AA97ELE8_9FLAO|nr:DUF4835 family protein [Hwangdonia sp. SCSIO 19198]WOD43644.1 DUF4835 family protein [Hwangdonia sp. SCSIO 19198]
MRNIILILLVSFGVNGFSQELNCNIVVNALQTGNENLQIFKTLEKQLNEFVNNTKWTNKTYANQERINCSMVISITNFSGEAFQGTLQVQSSRPVFGSSYSTPLYSFNDKDFSFRYLEFQNLTFNPTQFESNLVSVLAFHIYMILAIDADSFSENGGDSYYSQAQTITNYSQQQNFKGWKVEDGLQSRFALIDNVLSPTFKEYRAVMYNYHIHGLDIMSDDAKGGKEQIADALMTFNAMNSRRPNSFVLRTFFDAKADEIQQIFSDGPNVNITNVKDMLQKVAPTHAAKWRNIKF